MPLQLVDNLTIQSIVMDYVGFQWHATFMYRLLPSTLKEFHIFYDYRNLSR